MESLEERFLLDGAAAHLVDDEVEAWTNQPAMTLRVLANDDFDRGYAGARQITSVSYGSAGGRVEIAAGRRTLVYSPPPDFEGDETFVYLVDNAFAAEVTVSVVSPVETEDDEFEVVQFAGPVVLDVLENDSFLPAYTGPRRIHFVSETSEGGRVEIIDQGRRIRYTPAPDADDFDSFSYFVDDGFEGEVEITLVAPIEAEPDYFETVEGGEPVEFDVLANDSFLPEYSGPRRISFVSETTAGSRVEIIDAGRRVRYTPAPDAAGFDNFSYAVDDHVEATVSVTLRVPIGAAPDHFDVVEASGPIELDVLANDWFHRDYAGPRQISGVGETTAGSRVEVIDAGRRIRYTPEPNATGSDSFSYFVDGEFEANVAITLHAPTRDDSFEVRADQSVRLLDVLANDAFDSGYAGDGLITSVSAGSAGGRVELSADRRTLVYTPPPNFHGEDKFVYVVDDRFSARVTVMVVSPVVDDRFEIVQASEPSDFNLLANDLFTPGYAGPRRIQFVSESSAGGDVEVIDGGRRVRYTPPDDLIGYDTFSYFVDDLFEAKVTVIVRSPVLDDSFEVAEESTNNRLDLTANDVVQFDSTNRTQDAVDRITSVTASAQGGTVEVTADGQGVRYTPPPGFIGTDHFEYVADNLFRASVSVFVRRAMNDDYPEVDQGSADNVLHLTGNDYVQFYLPYRVDDVVDRITSVSAPTQGGTVAIAADGQGVLYSPPPRFIGTDQFDYVADGVYKGTVSVRVTRPVRDDSFSVFQSSGPQRLDVIANDFYSRVFTGNRTITAVTPADHGGVVEIIEGGQFLQYTPPDRFTGYDSFTYTIGDEIDARVSVYVQSRARSDYYNFCVAPALRLPVLDNDAIAWDYSGPGRITAATVSSGEGAVQIAPDGKQMLFNVTRLPASYYTSSTIHYTVDDRFEGDVTLWVYGNYLRFDSFRVDQNSPPTILDVKANDDFQYGCWQDGAPQPYSGPGLVTAVSQSANGGEVRVAADGQTVRYSPPPDFVGTDSFTYDVDGVQQATAYVQVIRRVRDDRFRVGHNSAANPLAVLINDGFGTDYAGARRITAVTATASGGSVAIRDAGRRIFYTPPLGFAGTDTFGYTVDGQLKARVSVVVQPPDVLEAFGTDDALEQFLVDRALRQYGYLLDQPARTEYEYSYRDDGIGRSYAMINYAYDIVGNDYADGTFAATRMSVPVLASYHAAALSFSPNALWEDVSGQAAAIHLPALHPSFSQTNVQVAGVDEGDIIENDGRYLYVLTGNELIIVQAWPAAQLREVSRMKFDGDPIAMYLLGDRLTIISNRAPTRITLLDVADRSAPRVVETADFDGNYVDSRAIGDHVYLVLEDQLAEPPAPRQVCEVIPNRSDTDPAEPQNSASSPDGSQSAAEPVELTTVTVAHSIYVDDVAYVDYDADFFPVSRLYYGGWSVATPVRTCRYETRDEYVARFHTERDDLFRQTLPTVTTSRPGESPTTTAVHTADDILRPLVASADKLVSIVSFDVAAADPHIADTEAVFADGAAKIYGSLDNLFVFDQDWSSDDGTTTPILEFAWNDPSGDVRLVATGNVPGVLLNQFSADEHGGYLRVATTIDGWLQPDGRSINDLFVLQADQGILEVVGALQDVAPGETIRSMRFMGDRAFMTTFREIDPLFAIDLADPAAPRVVGELHIPGFSSYMQPIDSNHLLTVGLNTVDGRTGPPQVSLFDISDMTHPLVIDNYTFERFSTTEATLDHHAFGWFAEHQTLAIPTGRTYPVREDTDGDGFRETRRWVREDELLVFRIDVTPRVRSDDGIQLVGSVNHTSAVRRGAYVGDVLYSVAAGSIKAQPIHDPSKLIAALTIGSEDPSGYPRTVTRLAASLATDGGLNPDPSGDPPGGGGSTPHDPIADLPDSSVSLLADPSAPASTMLVIVGTDRDDRIVIRSAHHGRKFTVRVNGKRHGPFDAAIVDRILVAGRAGDDSVHMTKRLHTPVTTNEAKIVRPSDRSSSADRLGSLLSHANSHRRSHQ